MDDQEPSTSKKRKSLELEDESKPMCKYGRDCYRKNPVHFQEFRHPDSHAPAAKRVKADNPWTGISKEKLIPFLLTKVRGIPSNFNSERIAIGIKDILSLDDGELKASAQFNYMFDIPWLMEQYPERSRSKPLLIVHGETGASKVNLEAEAQPFKNVTFFQARLSIAYGTHHSKMMLFLYQNGMRVVIHTANMIEQDWGQKTQGRYLCPVEAVYLSNERSTPDDVWVSPLFPKLEEGAVAGDKFKKDLLEYLSAYGASGSLDDWKKHIRAHSMTEARVRIVASVPGRHTSTAKYKWGHMRLREILQQIGPDLSIIDSNWPVIGQFSSVGSLGIDHKKWLCSEWLESLAAGKKKITLEAQVRPKLQLIFPSVENVRTSLEGYKAGGSLPYSADTAKKQPYIVDYLHTKLEDEKSGQCYPFS